ncbi:6-pyruvoyl tetrahydropterin synthase family protein [soil metagenome]
MIERYTVRVTKDTLVFSAGHFITFGNGVCERLHGHNYRVAVEVDGPLIPGDYVFDFIALRDSTREIVDELDHRMLLPLGNEHFHLVESPTSVSVTYRDKEWVFPREDCVLLPLANTTAELLAKYIAGRLLNVLKSQHQFVPQVLRVEVEECFGQIAEYEINGNV